MPCEPLEEAAGELVWDQHQEHAKGAALKNAALAGTQGGRPEQALSQSQPMARFAAS